MPLTLEIKILLGLSGLIVSTVLFYLASDSLNPTKLNLVNYIYYNFMVFTFFGGTLAFLGIRDHYLIAKVRDENVFTQTYFVIILFAILFPLIIWGFNQASRKLFGHNNYGQYIKQPTIDLYDGLVEMFIIISFTLLCYGTVILFHQEANHIPFLGWISGGDLTIARQTLTRTDFIHPYLKAIFMLHLPIHLSYYAYIKARISKNRTWWMIFLSLLFLALVVRTYNYEKAPAIFYLFNFFLIEVLLGNIKSLKVPMMIAGIMVVAILVIYFGFMRYEGPMLSIVDGPFSRIVFSQVAGLFFSLKYFPTTVPFLNGSSFPTIITRLLGIKNSWIRSGRVIMELVNPRGIEAGTAGVMSTIFIGESYANWGMLGMLGSIVFVALLFSGSQQLLMTSKKTPINLTLYVMFFSYFSTWFQGGFVDYVFSTPVALLLLFFIVFKVVLVFTSQNANKSNQLVGGTFESSLNK